MKRRLVVVLAAVGVLVVAGCAGLLSQRARFERGWWAWQAARPLAPSELTEIARCDKRIDWNTTLRVVLQDLDTPCGDDHVVRSTSEALDGHGLRRTWLAERLTDPGTLPGARARISATLLELAVDDPEIRWAAGEPRLTGDRARWWHGRLATSEEVPTWADPGLRLAISVTRLVGGLDRDAGDARRLAWAVAHPPPRPIDTDAVAVRVVGVDLEDARARLRTGRPLQDVPPAWVPILARRADDCTARGSAPCLDLLLTLLDAAPEEEGEAPADRADAPAARSAIDAFWRALFDGDERRVAAAADELDAWLGWASDRPAAETILRLTTTGGLAAEAPPGDPIEALRRRGGSPWASAWAAVLLGDRLQVPVAVGERDGWVDLQIGEARVQLAPCGSRTPPADEEGRMEPLVPFPAAAVAARSTLEAALAAGRTGHRERAVRLAALATRLDPTLAGARAAVDAVSAPDTSPAAEAGRRAGQALRWPGFPGAPASPPRGLPPPPPTCPAAVAR